MRKESFLYGRLNSVAIENKSNISVSFLPSDGFMYGMQVTLAFKSFSKQAAPAEKFLKNAQSFFTMQTFSDRRESVPRNVE